MDTKTRLKEKSEILADESDDESEGTIRDNEAEAIV
jgi:hypothetical protein